MTTPAWPAYDPAEPGRREAAEEAAIKLHYFGKWLAEAGVPEHIIAGLLAGKSWTAIDDVGEGTAFVDQFWTGFRRDAAATAARLAAEKKKRG